MQAERELKQLIFLKPLHNLMISSILPNKAGYVDVCEGGHQVLTVEAIHDAAVSWDGAGKVLQVEQNRAASHHWFVCR